MVRAAFAQAGLKQSAEIWYQEFINVIWLHGDLSIGMVNVRIQQHDYTDDKDLIEMMITDQEGNIMSLWGFENDYIDIVMYKGEVYAGPYTG